MHIGEKFDDLMVEMVWDGQLKPENYKQRIPKKIIAKKPDVKITKLTDKDLLKMGIPLSKRELEYQKITSTKGDDPLKMKWSVGGNIFDMNLEARILKKVRQKNLRDTMAVDRERAKSLFLCAGVGDSFERHRFARPTVFNPVSPRTRAFSHV